MKEIIIRVLFGPEGRDVHTGWFQVIDGDVTLYSGSDPHMAAKAIEDVRK